VCNKGWHRRQRAMMRGEAKVRPQAIENTSYLMSLVQVLEERFLVNTQVQTGGERPNFGGSELACEAG